MERKVPLQLLLQCVLALVVHASTEPRNGESYQTTFAGRGGGLVYTDASGSPYFSDNLNFDAIDGKIMIGAADKLYIFDKDLNVPEGGVYTWPTEVGVSCPSQVDEYVCRNHIRIYQQPTEASNTLFVCGTQSGVAPQCRVLNIRGSSLVETGQPRATSLISAHPDLPGFGEFRRGIPRNVTTDVFPADDVYFTANFRTTVSNSYDISYQQVNISEGGDMGVETSRLYGWNTTNMFWLNSPVVFVDYRRVDAGTSQQFEFYFVFLRERVGEEIQSRVVRLCRNDAGVIFKNTRNNPPTSAKIFNNFLKARIMCERETPPGTEFIGAQDFNYNEMWSAAFNSPVGGRYHETTSYMHMMYGAFSGPRIGPVGTAICVYRASMSTTSSLVGRKRGLFDPFREDVRESSDGTPIENNHIMCDPAGRPADLSQYVQAEHNVEQLVENPLLVVDGFYVTQMVVDQVCVVRRDNNRACVNQDVLFLGTSDGRVLKVVFATDVGGSGNILPIFPVVAEEIKLSAPENVKEMKIDIVGGTKQLYVVTSSKIHRMPLEQCTRHGNNLTSCIGSRDPYCAWDARQSSCAYSNLTAAGNETGQVPIYIRQNIHTGEVNLPNVRFDMESYTTGEGSSDRLWVTVTSDQLVASGVVEVDIRDITAQVGVNVFSSADPVPIVFQQTSSNPVRYEDLFMIEARRDRVFNGNLQFQLSLRNTIAGAVYFPQQNATVTIIDIDGTYFRVGFRNLASECRVWKTVYTNAAKLLSNEIAEGINIPENNVVNVSLNCSDDDSKYVTLFGVLLATSDRSIDNLLDTLQTWISGAKIESFDIEADKDCLVRIPSTNNTLCTPSGQTGGVAEPMVAASTGTVTGLAVVFALVVVAAVALLLVVIVLSLMLWRANKRHHSSEVTPEKNDTKLSHVNGGEGGAYDDITAPPHVYDDVPNRQSLAEKRGSVDLHIDITAEPFANDTNPKSSDPLIGMRFFTDSGEDHAPLQAETNGIHLQSSGIDDVVRNAGTVSPEHNGSYTEQHL